MTTKRRPDNSHKDDSTIGSGDNSPSMRRSRITTRQRLILLEAADYHRNRAQNTLTPWKRVRHWLTSLIRIGTGG